MRMYKKILLALLTAALIAGCALLPSAVALWQDHRQLGRIETEPIEPIALHADDSSLLDRLRLCSSNQLYCEVQNMPIGTGVRYQENTIMEQAHTELTLLHEKGILVLDPDLYTAKVVGVDFLADPGDPANNAMVWRIVFYSETGMIQVLIDDESGHIVLLRADDEEIMPSPQELDVTAAVWADYLGLALVETTSADEERIRITDAEKYGYAKEDLGAVRLAYSSVTLAHPDDPNGFAVQYLLRVSENTLWITIA